MSGGVVRRSETASCTGSSSEVRARLFRLSEVGPTSRLITTSTATLELVAVSGVASGAADSAAPVTGLGLVPSGIVQYVLPSVPA